MIISVFFLIYIQLRQRLRFTFFLYECLVVSAHLFNRLTTDLPWHHYWKSTDCMCGSTNFLLGFMISIYIHPYTNNILSRLLYVYIRLKYNFWWFNSTNNPFLLLIREIFHRYKSNHIYQHSEYKNHFIPK